MPDITVIILTGGDASRMQPLSFEKVKCMIPYMGKPLLLPLIQSLKADRFREIVFTSAGKKGEVKEYFDDGKNFGVHIRYASDANWRGTAGTLKDIIDSMGGEISNPFMVIYGDSLLKADYATMFAFHNANKSSCTILYHRPNFASFLYHYHDKSLPDRGERTNFGVMNLESDNRITKVIEKATLEEIPHEFVNPVANGVVYILEREVLDFIPPNDKFDFPADLFPSLIKQGVSCFGFDVGEGYRLDIGTIIHYYSFQFATLQGKIAFDFQYPLIEQDLWVGETSTVGSIEKLCKPVLIGINSRIAADSAINCSIIGSNVSIGNSSSITRTIVLDNARIGSGVRITNSIIGENSVIGDNAVVPPNTVLGNFCELGGSELLMKESDLHGLVDNKAQG